MLSPAAMFRQALLLALGLLAACNSGPAVPAGDRAAPVEIAAPVPVVLPPDLAAFYAARGNQPLWITDRVLRPEAQAMIAILGRAADHGLDPERYGAAELTRAAEAAAGGEPAALARAELLLSRGFTAFVSDLRGAGAKGGMRHIEDGLAPAAVDRAALLAEAAAAPSLGAWIAETTRMSPLYEHLVAGHVRWRAGPGAKSEKQRVSILANLDRARAIPVTTGRQVIVDTASARLWMVDGGRVEGPMRVIVGKPGMQTPSMAGFIRYATLNPWWNLPPDLARDRAKRIVREGPGLVARENLEILSDWSDRARPIPAKAVNWSAVAAGRRSLRMRQRPGGANVMGAVKFMLPNDLGIYLHDFPDKSLFARGDRRLSSGCVRLADAPRLGRFLFGGEAPRPNGPRPEQRVDLPTPVPVYITYLTVLPGGPDGLTFQPDSYAREVPRRT